MPGRAPARANFHAIGRALGLGALGLAVLGGAVVGTGCARDPHPACSELYHHLVGLAKRNADPEGEVKFVAACIDAWDPGRVKCLEAAKTVGEALACKPVKKRPG